MNKTEKIICLLLGGVLAWYIFLEMPRQQKAQREAAVAAQKARSANVQAAAKAAGRNLKDMTLEEMDALWESAKVRR